MADTAPQRATMIEVARRAQVSHQTVSRYFSANEGLKPATRARIDAAVKELNYRPTSSHDPCELGRPAGSQWSCRLSHTAPPACSPARARRPTLRALPSMC